MSAPTFRCADAVTYRGKHAIIIGFCGFSGQWARIEIVATGERLAVACDQLERRVVEATICATRRSWVPVIHLGGRP